MDPFNQPSGFLGLLTSQLPDDAFPTQFMSSEQHPGTETSPAAAPEDRQVRVRWSSVEDVVLIHAWLNTSKDPITGTDQKAGHFWKRIADLYAADPKVANLPKREPSHCKQRWGKINEACQRFVGCYAYASRNKSSGQNEDDVLRIAHETYLNDYHLKFTVEHGWRELRFDQKWCGMYGNPKESGSSKKRKIGEDQSFQSSTSFPSINDEAAAGGRPPGVKAAKAKAKKKVGDEKNELSDYKTMWEIRREDAAFKKKLSRQKILESLLGRSDPLTEIEVTLKNKLIAEILEK